MKFSRIFVSECLEKSSFKKHVANPIFRKSFELKKAVERAEITICGLGFYDLYVNGKKITKGYLAPYISNPNHIVYYDNYEISSYLRVGENVIGVMLGDGFINSKTCIWSFNENVFNSAPKMAISVELFEDGGVREFEATDFVCKKGAYTFNCLRSGVFFDNRLYEAGWCDVDFVEENWHAPISVPRPSGKAKLCEAEPIKVTREIKPVKIYRGKLSPYVERVGVAAMIEKEGIERDPHDRENGYVFDFGENNSGIYRLKIKGERGQVVDVQCSERITPDGEVDYNNVHYYPDGYSQRDKYTLSGEGVEIFEPQFTYHGYRYLYITGITEEQATEDLVTYLVMSSDLKRTGGFTCSDETVNRILEAAGRSDISNFFYFPNDCPHREKNGWTGDASISSEHLVMTLDCERSFEEWLNNIRLAQGEDGIIPGVIPTDTFGYTWGNGPTWDSVLFNLPFYLFKYRGNTKVIRDNAHAMLRYLEYISRKRDRRGLVEYGLGDWVPVGRKNADDYEAPLGLTDSVMVVDMCRKAEVMFDAIGFNLHKDFANKLGGEMLEAVRKEYINFSTMTVKSECQSAQALSIFYGIFTESERKLATDKLVEIIERDGKFFTVGFIGLRTMFHVLANAGYADLAHYMITREEFPSYAYHINSGETTMPEAFKTTLNNKESRDSKNHHFLGDVTNWYIRCVAGIDVVAHDKVNIKPNFIEGLDFAEAYYDLPSGRVSARWERVDGGVSVTVDAPDGVLCEIELESGYWFEDTRRSYFDGSKCKKFAVKR